MTEDELILTAVLNCSRTELLTRRRTLTPNELERIGSMKTRRARGEPLQYVIGFTEFLGSRLRVNEDVLIPRPETELLVEKVLDRLKPWGRPLKVLDLCAGSGNIAIVLARHLPQISVTAVDISAEALNVAASNARENGVDKKIRFFCFPADKFLYDINEESFDLIVSNPPYVPTRQMADLPEDVKREPAIALDGGEDGLDFYRLILKQAGGRLVSGGLLALEIGEDQQASLTGILDVFPVYQNIEFETDLAGKTRYLFMYKKRTPNYLSAHN